MHHHLAGFRLSVSLKISWLPPIKLIGYHIIKIRNTGWNLPEIKNWARFTTPFSIAKMIYWYERNLKIIFWIIFQPSAVTISDDSSLIATGFEDGLIRIFSVGSDRLKEMKTPAELEMVERDRMDLESILKLSNDNCRSLIGHSGSVFGVSISPRRDFLVSGGEDGTVRLWSLMVYCFSEQDCS